MIVWDCSQLFTKVACLDLVTAWDYSQLYRRVACLDSHRHRDLLLNIVEGKIQETNNSGHSRNNYTTQTGKNINAQMWLHFVKDRFHCTRIPLLVLLHNWTFSWTTYPCHHLQFIIASCWCTVRVCKVHTGAPSFPLLSKKARHLIHYLNTSSSVESDWALMGLSWVQCCWFLITISTVTIHYFWIRWCKSPLTNIFFKNSGPWDEPYLLES